MNINKLTLGYKNVNYTNLKNEDKKEAAEKKEAPVENNKPAEQQVSADKVFEFLSSNAVAIRPLKAANVSAKSADRIAASLEEFEKIYAIAEEEFGAEAALAILDKMCE